MQKHKKKILGVVILVIIAIVFFSVRSVLNSVRTADVSKTETSAKTTDGATCNNDEKLNEHYEPIVSWDPESKVATITVQNGSFKVTKISGVSYDSGGNSYTIDPMSVLTTNPTTLGVITPNKPMKISYQNASADITLHFIMTETDDICLSYDEASTNSEGQKVGTYEFDMTLQIRKQGETPKKSNSNYNGICAVFRTGQGYNTNDFTVVDSDGNKRVAVSKEIFDKYNYAAVSSAGKQKYEELIPYCFQADNVNFNYSKAQVASMISSAIDIWQATELVGDAASSEPSKEFMSAFNDAKEKALKLHHDFSSKLVDGANGSEIDATFGLTCDWQKKATGTKGDAYYVNKDYYYAKETEVTDVEYTYKYTSGNIEKVNGGSCTRECEEAVVVEYGPPVASKAGLCFEYKVRVTSRVVCNSSLKLTPPTTPSICTPTPYCNQISGHVHQGGPNDEFEQCIQECDGGKYSQSCSNKCYNEVYVEDNDEEIDPLTIRYGDDYIVQKVWSEIFPGYDGKYAWSDGKIVWQGSGYGRWYKEFEDSRTRSDHGDYNVYDGFKKNDYGDGNHCQDNCYWSGCSTNSYLNEEDAAADTISNLQIYNQAVSQCNAAASCTTKTGVFTISVDYIDGEGEKVTKSFPLESSSVDNATLPSLGAGQNHSQSGTEIFIPDTNPDGYAGCYDSGSARNWYQAEWSFPGTWINNKTGEISYDNSGKDNAWHYKEDKFCIPLDARSVNTLWWEWSEVNDECYTGDIEDTIDYNIHASTADFGYFGWNFDIECFYGLRNETCDLDQKGCCIDCVPGEADCPNDDDTPDTTNLRDYTFRIVDTTELFPESKETTEDNNPTISSVGRQPGYNWTLGMTNEDTSILTSLNAKNSSYHIDPLALINTIQDRGESIYSDDKYIDYQLVLDKETLAKIRDFNRDKQYTEYTGDTKEVNGVTVYYSKLLTDLGSGVVRERGEIGVNNEGEGE